jgi:hypothetical protein
VSYLCVFLGTTEYRITGNFKTYKLMEEQMVTARIAYRSIRKSKSYAPPKTIMEQDRDHSSHQVMVASHILYVNFVFLKHSYVFSSKTLICQMNTPISERYMKYRIQFVMAPDSSHTKNRNTKMKSVKGLDVKFTFGTAA